MAPRRRAIRVSAPGDDPGIVRQRALELGLRGWARTGAEGKTVSAHAEGGGGAIDALVAFLGADARVDAAKVEGHEQFAIRGVSAGRFVVAEHAATARHFDLRLEVDGVMRSWAVPKGPSLDPAVKRFAVQVSDHTGIDPEGAHKIVWDQGLYEQGGRVPWPEAIERGHAVFVLHGEKLRGGFALQRTRGGDKPQWLLVKRRDEAARPGSDIAAERPESVISGRTLDEVLGPG
jgi:DNA ligase D-like protein (predicted 3'-phosphoesterase)